MRLETAPTADVTITLTSTLTGLTVTPATLTFTADNWRVAQTITVDASSYDDTDKDDEATDVTLTAASADSSYDGLTATIAVTVTDDDKPALIVDTDSVTVAEGSTADIVGRLKTAPAIAVTIAVSSDDPAAATVTPTSLTFAAGTGLTPQASLSPPLTTPTPPTQQRQ